MLLLPAHSAAPARSPAALLTARPLPTAHRRVSVTHHGAACRTHSCGKRWQERSGGGGGGGRALITHTLCSVWMHECMQGASAATALLIADPCCSTHALTDERTHPCSHSSCPGTTLLVPSRSSRLIRKSNTLRQVREQCTCELKQCNSAGKMQQVVCCARVGVRNEQH